MPPRVLGSALLVVGAVLCAVAFVAARRGHHRLALLCLVGLGLLLRAYAASDLYLHEWDERYHALVAKNLLRHPLRPTLYDDPLLPYDERHWFENHVWLHKPPLALWLLALGLRLFGIGELALRAPSVVLSGAAVGLTYALGARLFGRTTGLLAAFLHAVNGFLIDLAAGRRPTDHVDSLFVVLVEAGVFLAFVAAERGHPPALAAAIGLLTGLAYLTKSAPALLIVAVWLALLVGRTRAAAGLRAMALALLVAAAVAAPWSLYVRAAFPREFAWESAYELRHLFEPLEGHTGPVWAHLLWMPRFFGELAYVPVLCFLWRAARERRPMQVALAVWLLLPYLVFSLVATKMPAYVMIAAPAVFLMEAELAKSLLSSAAAATRPARVAGGLLFALLLLLPVRFALERTRPLSGDDRRRPWAEDLRALEASLPAGPCVLFGVAQPIEAMFYTHCTAYPGPLPEAVVVLRLERAGYQVLRHP